MYGHSTAAAGVMLQHARRPIGRNRVHRDDSHRLLHNNHINTNDDGDGDNSMESFLRSWYFFS
jgi:hypothetical protein